MIILKILLFILLAVLGVILLVLIMPVGGEVSFIGGKLKFKVKLWIINVMDSEGGGILGWLKKRKSKKKPSKKKKPKPQKKKKSKKKKKSDTPPDIVFDTPAAEETSVQTEDTAVQQSTVSAVPASSEESSGSGQAQTGFYTSGDEANEPEVEASPDEETEETDGKKKKKKKKEKEKKSLDELVDMLVDIWGSAKNPLCLIFKAFKFSDLYIDFVIANEDAYKCALNYGRLSAVTYRGIAQMSRIFTVKLKTVDIQPAFGMKKGRYDAALKLHFRAGTFVIAGLWFLITFIFRVFIPGKIRKIKAKKSAAAQK
ncbi:MAG: hypothetical protein IKK91_03665 [Ruminococcus sp.]|nr:hypothetical protein [Ruminococcus sp.]